MVGVAESDLGKVEPGLTALDLPPSRSGYHVGLLYRRETLGDPVGYCTDLSAEVTHGCCVAAWDVGLPPAIRCSSQESKKHRTVHRSSAHWPNWPVITAASTGV